MEIIQAMCAVHSLSDKSKKLLGELVTERSYPKGHHLLNLWQVPQHFYFLVKGAGRVYYMREGQDISDYLALDMSFVGAVPALFTGEPSHKAVELLEDSVVQSFIYRDFEKLCDENLELGTLGRKMAVLAVLQGQKRIEDLRFLSAAERYRELLQKYPGITNRISLKHLASYLGTTQVSLSRIRGGKQ